jgi:uncharacterized protein (DUF1697 family)
MPELKRCFEAAGFGDVRTLLASGNVLFSARQAPPGALAQAAEKAMQRELGRTFLAMVRPVDALQALLDSDPYAPFRLPPDEKRVVTFLRGALRPMPSLPVEEDGARILCARGGEVFSAYVRSPRGPVFMKLIERTLGTELTTRTWDTVRKAAAPR